MNLSLIVHTRKHSEVQLSKSLAISDQTSAKKTTNPLILMYTYYVSLDQRYSSGIEYNREYINKYYCNNKITYK